MAISPKQLLYHGLTFWFGKEEDEKKRGLQGDTLFEQIFTQWV